MRKHVLLAVVAATGCGGGDGPEIVVDDGSGGAATQIEVAGTPVGQSAVAAVRVSNAGGRATGPLALAISGAAANDFTLDNERTTCAGAALDPGASCDVALVFRPRAAGERLATLSIASEPGGVAQVALLGQGLLASLVFSPASLDFGRLEAGHLAQTTIELRNEGPAAVPLDSIDVAGPGFARGISTCGAALGPGESCDIAVRFTPQALGPLTGSLVAISSGTGYTAALDGAGARRIKIALTGTGGGSVTSAPVGIDCGATCEALFETDAITLSAVPGASSVLVGWSVGSCGQGTTCALPAQLDPLTVTVSFALDGPSSLDVVFAGNASGEVQIESLLPGAPVTCFASCTVPLQPGEQYTITPSTPSGFGGITGACTSTTSHCTFTAPLGGAIATVTFAKDPKEQWTRLPGTAPIRALAYDGAGNLIVAAGALSKLSPAGATIWTLPLAGVHHLAVGPGGSIHVVDTMLRKLDAAGVELWAQPLPQHAQGCQLADAFEHCLAVGASGVVAVRGATGLASWTPSGVLSWDVPIPSGPRAIAIDNAGIVNVAAESAIDPDHIDILRFSSNGSSLQPLELYISEYHGMLAIDGGGQLMATASGHGNVKVKTAAWTRSFTTSDSDWVPTGTAAAGNGDVLWVYQPEDLGSPATSWIARRYNSAGVQQWSLSRGGLSSVFLGALGATPVDVAAGPAGQLAVGGTYTGLTYTGGWIQTFAP